MTLVECDDDDSASGLFSLIELNDQVPGTVYYVAVWEYGNNVTGSFQMSAYDDQTCSPAAYTTSTTLDCSAEGTFTVTLEFTDLGSASEIVLTDNQGSAAQTVNAAGSYTFGPYAEGTSVEIMGDAGDVNCNFEETFTEFCPVENNDCADAIQLTVGSTFESDAVVGNNTGATDSAIAAPSCGNYQGGDVWYSFTVPASGHVYVETGFADESMTNFDTVIAVYSGTCDGTLTEIDCDDDGADAGNFSYMELSDLTPGEVLLVRVFEYFNDNVGSFAISVYDDAVVEPCVPPTITTTTQVDCEAGTYTVIYTVTDLGSSEFFDLYDDSNSTVYTVMQTGEYIMGPYNVGTEVEIFVGTTDMECNSSETYVEFCDAPANDNCEGAIELTVGTTYMENMVTGTNIGATDGDMSAPSCGNYQGGDVWYMVTVPESTTLVVETQSDDNGISSTGIAAYVGSCDGTMTEVLCDSSEDGFAMLSAGNLTPGDVYYIRVWSNGNDLGTFQISAYSENFAVNDYTANANVKLYPNPTTQVLNISGINAANVQVFAASGKLVKVNTNGNVVDVRNLTTGTYIIRITDNVGNVVQRKFIKK